MEPLTYKLNPERSAFSTYYRDIVSFTDEVLGQSQSSILPLASRYRHFLQTSGLDECRSLEENVFELLNLGILWRAYGNTAISVGIAPFQTMARLGEWRKTHPRLKPAIDAVRGLLLSFFLVPISVCKTTQAPQVLSDLERLVTWLEATGDFREDAFRYIRLLAFFSLQPGSDFAAMMTALMELADWFEEEGAKKLGFYTPNVDSFVEQKTKNYRWREDRFACLRSRTEYHLAMVGAEIMNRTYAADFRACSQKTVLAPGCMRKRSEGECEGIKTEKGTRCTGCESRCHINQLREIGLRDNFDVMIIPHSTDLGQWSVKPGEKPTAVVGVACLSVLVEGGWELRRNNVPAQCVVLNQCGCQKHWHDKGFPTEIDLRQLKQLIHPN